MYLLHGCPKCDGALYEDRDRYDTFWGCVQCGRYLTDAEQARLELAIERAATLADEAVVVEKIA